MKKILFLLSVLCFFVQLQAQISTTLSLDGNTQFASAPQGLMNGATVFTIEFWVKTTETRSNGTYWQKPTLIGWANPSAPDGDFGITTSNGKIGVWGGINSGGDQSFESSTVSINDNNWHHIAASNDGSVVRLFVDGVQVGSINSGTGIQTNLGALGIGASVVNANVSGNSYASTNSPHQGIFSEVRFSSNARYTANFTPSSSLGTDANTVALYHFASVCGVKSPDASGNNNDLVVNNNSASCSTLPFSSDFSFNGTNQYGRMPAGLLNGLSTFTIEGWIKSTDMNVTPNGELWRSPNLVGNASPGGASGDFIIFTQGGYLGLYTGMNTGTGDNYFVSKAFFSDNRWHHFAVSANGTTATLFADGVNVGSLSINRGIATSGADALGIMVNNSSFLGGPYYKHAGELDELRVSGSAKYSANFTPQAGAFTADASTLALYHFDGCSNHSIPDATANNNNAVPHGFTGCATPLNVQNGVLYSHHNAFVAGGISDTVYVLTNNGTSQTFLTQGFRPRLSHDGQYMAFSNGPNPNSSYAANLWLLNLQTGDEDFVLSNSDYLDYYDFSPHNKKLIYSQGCSVYSTNLDGSNSYTSVTCNPCDCFSDDPTVRVTDSMLAYHNYHYGIYTANFDGSSSAQVTNTIPGDLFPAWSNNGQWIAFMRETPGLFPNRIYKVRPDGTGFTQLLQLGATDSLAPGPVWSSNLGTIYFIGKVSGTLGLYEVLTDGSGTYHLDYTFNSASMQDYWLGMTDAPSSIFVLPLRLTGLSGQYLANKTVDLKWQTNDEINTDRFEIERSFDGSKFATIGSVAAHNGSLNYSYLFKDAQLQSNRIIYYRLKMIDVDGKFTFSKIVRIATSAMEQVVLYPNPNKGVFMISLGGVNKKLEVTVTDALGRNIYHEVFYNSSSQEIKLAAGKGVYRIKVTGDGGSSEQNVVIQ